MTEQNETPHRRTLALLDDVRAQNAGLVGISPARMTQDGWLRAASEVAGLLWLNPIPGAIVLLTHAEAGNLARQVGRQSGRPSVVVACRQKGVVEVDCWEPSSGAREASLKIRTDEERYPVLVEAIARGNGQDLVDWVLSEGRNAASMNLLREEMLGTTAAWKGGGRHATEDERRYLTVLLFARLLCVSYLSTQCAATRAALDDVLSMEDAWSGWSALVHGALNEPADARTGVASEWGVPYLNGGLFSQSAVERDCAFFLDGPRLRDLASLFLRLCVLTESGGPALSLDPVVISQLYESTLDSSTRASTGSFFTPVALSRRMAKQAVDHLVGGLTDPDAVSIALESAMVLDPACGSGTLLVAVFDEIVARLQNIGTGRCVRESESTLRRRIVGNLCGVDTSPLAATLCELRLWMSILAADVRSDVSLPLPNLSHRIRVGDALSSIWDYNADNPAHAVARRVLERHRELNDALLFSTGEAKSLLLRELNEVEREISGAMEFASRALEITDRSPPTLPLFDPRPDTLAGVEGSPRPASAAAGSAYRRAGGADLEVAFADVLEDGGFSIVIGNPPWVRLSAVAVANRRRICRRFDWMDTSSRRAFGVQPDLSIAFVQRATQLVRDGGIISMLVPSKVLSMSSAVRFRVGMVQSSSILEIHDLQGDAAARFAADVYPLLLCARSSSVESGSMVRVLRGGSVFHVKQSTLGETGDAERKWLLMPEDELALVGHLLRLGEGEMCWRGPTGIYGMKTGCNAAFESQGGEEFEVDVIGGRDVGTMALRGERKRMVLPYCWKGVRALREEEVGEGTRLRFEGWRERLEARADWVRGDAIWSVFRLPMDGAGWRVVWRDIAKVLEAAPVRPVGEGGPVGLNTVYVVPVRNEDEAVTLSAWLNLTPARLVAAALAEPALGGYRRFRAASVCQVPVGDVVWNRNHEFHAEFVRASYRWRDGDVEARVRLEEMALMEGGLTDAVSTVVRACRRLGLSEDGGHFSNFVV